jgi:hypothetical protein
VPSLRYGTLPVCHNITMHTHCTALHSGHTDNTGLHFTRRTSTGPTTAYTIQATLGRGSQNVPQPHSGLHNPLVARPKVHVTAVTDHVGSFKQQNTDLIGFIALDQGNLSVGTRLNYSLNTTASCFFYYSCKELTAALENCGLSMTANFPANNRHIL